MDQVDILKRPSNRNVGAAYVSSALDLYFSEVGSFNELSPSRRAPGEGRQQRYKHQQESASF